MKKTIIEILTAAVLMVLGACGVGGGGASGSAPSVTPSLALLAGDIGGGGNIDGVGGAARFQGPFALATDAAGNVFVADSDNHTIRKITLSGSVTTFAGAAGQAGADDGTGGAARFSGPTGIAVDATGNLYVADSGNDTIRRITPTGVVTTYAGSPGGCGSADGVGAAARFCGPYGLALDAGDNLYVADSINHTIRLITSGAVVSTLVGSPGMAGAVDGTGGAARFNYPGGLALDGGGNLYVADVNNHTIRRIALPNTVTTFAGIAGTNGAVDGSGASARFYNPTGVAVDTGGNVFVADSANHIIRMITPTATVSTYAGSAALQGPDDGTGAAARFNYPYGIAVDSSGNVYVAEGGNQLIRKITAAAEVTTLAGAAERTGHVDAQGPLARFLTPQAIVADTSGNAYVADGGYSAGLRLIDGLGNVTTLSNTAGLNNPYGLARDAAGNLYIADTYHHVIQKLDTSGTLTLLAGSGTAGAVDGPALSASFNTPSGVAVDPVTGIVYVADTGNHTVRAISPAGDVTTLAGAPGTTGHSDGNGSAARFNSPADLVCDATGMILVTDRGNGTIRKITPSAEVTTFAGSAAARGAVDGTGAAARFDFPSGMTIDGGGNLYVADINNHAIRKITPAAVVTTVVGGAGKIGVQLGALPASLYSPRDVAVQPDGQLLILTANGVVVTHGY